MRTKKHILHRNFLEICCYYHTLLIFASQMSLQVQACIRKPDLPSCCQNQLTPTRCKKKS